MSRPQREVMIPFEITATNLNLADTSLQTIHSFPNDGFIRVPTRLELKRDAGTAYTLSYPGGKKSGQRKVENFQREVDSYTAIFSGGPFLVIESKDDDDRSRPHIFIPEEGLLDVATAQTRLVFPLRDNHVFRAGATSFTLRSLAGLASGTGSLFGRFYFDEYTVGGF